MGRKIPTETVLAYFQERGVQPLFSEYQGSHTPLLFQCPFCPRTTTVLWTHIQQGKANLRCKECGWARQAPHPRKPTRETVAQEFATHGATLLEIEYKNAHQKLAFRCGCGRPHAMMLLNIRKGQRAACPRCTGQEGGPTSSRWLHHLTPEEREESRGYAGMSAWYAVIKRKAGYLCAITREKLDKRQLSSHHLYGYNAYPDLRRDLRNGVCLRRELHDAFHQEHGYGHNTLAQFQAFYTGSTGTLFRDPFHGYIPQPAF